jgi:hypothetical protein
MVASRSRAHWVWEFKNGVLILKFWGLLSALFFFSGDEFFDSQFYLRAWVAWCLASLL